MKHLMPTANNETEFLFPLRKRRDELLESMDGSYSSAGAEAIDAAMRGDLETFKRAFRADDDGWWSCEIEEFYDTCKLIKETEARLYDAAMKAA